MVRGLRQSPGYGRLLLGKTVSLIGDGATQMALTWIVLEATGSALAMGTVQALWILPTLLLLPFAGMASDRLPRIPLLIITDLVRAMVVGVAALLAFRGSLDLTAIYLLVVLMGAGGAFFMPTFQALRAEVLAPEFRTAGNALSGMARQAATLVGPMVGASLLAAFGSGATFTLDAFTYLTSVLCLAPLMRMAVPRPVRAKVLDVEEEPYLRQLAGGLRFITGSAWLWVTIAAFSLINALITSAIVVLLPWLIKEHLALGPSALALVMTASGVGAIGVGLVMGRVRYLKHRSGWAYGVIVLEGIAIMLIPLSGWFAAIVLLSVLRGACHTVFSIIWESSLQELVPREYFGRVVSLDMLGSLALTPIATIVVGAVAHSFGEISTMAVLGVLTAAVAGLAFSVRGVREYS